MGLAQRLTISSEFSSKTYYKHLGETGPELLYHTAACRPWYCCWLLMTWRPQSHSRAGDGALAHQHSLMCPQRTQCPVPNHMLSNRHRNNIVKNNFSKTLKILIMKLIAIHLFTYKNYQLNLNNRSTWVKLEYNETIKKDFRMATTSPIPIV